MWSDWELEGIEGDPIEDDLSWDRNWDDEWDEDYVEEYEFICLGCRRADCRECQCGFPTCDCRCHVKRRKSTRKMKDTKWFPESIGRRWEY